MPTPTEVTPFGRDYFTKSVILADPADLDIGQIARVKAMSGVQWSVLYVASGGATSAASIYPDRSGAAYATPSGTTGTDGTINFWAAPGEYRVVITDPSNRISVPNGYITWNSIPAWTEGVPGDFISGNKQITTTKIADLGITTAKIADLNVTAAKINNLDVTGAKLGPDAVSGPDKIADNAIQTEHILASNITTEKIASTVALVPLGTILDWFPPAAASGPDWGIPYAYVLCANQLWSSVPNDLGYTTGRVPDLVGKVTYGSAAATARGDNATHNTTSGAQTDAGVAGLTGAGAVNNSSHSHTVVAHTHDITHTHSLNAHTHTDGAHTHNTSAVFVGIPSKTLGAGLFAGVTTSNTSSSHLLQGTIGTANAGSTTSQSGSSTGGPSNNATGAASKGSVTENAALTTGAGGNIYDDNRPLGVGVLKIMKVLTA